MPEVRLQRTREAYQEESLCENCGKPESEGDHFDAWAADLGMGWCCEGPLADEEERLGVDD